MSASPILYAEDYKPGAVFELGQSGVTKDEIVAFARQWDPHPFHLDEAAAQATPFGGLIASGMHTMLLMLRLMHDGGFLHHETSVGSPGLDEVRWLKPVRPGDLLSGKIEVTSARLSKSRPEIGLVGNRATLTNQAGELVFSMKSTALIRSRQGAG